MKKKAYTIKQGMELAKEYCSIAERCQSEVFNKLIDWGLNQEEADEVISELILENYISETRFSKLYAISKFHQNHWGKKKISYSLKYKGISNQCIITGLDEIEEKEYLNICQRLYERKYLELKDRNPEVKKQKTINFLMGKGYEYDIIKQVIERKDGDN